MLTWTLRALLPAGRELHTLLLFTSLRQRYSVHATIGI